MSQQESEIEAQVRVHFVPAASGIRAAILFIWMKRRRKT
jgi:hypothetical protein